MDLYNNSAYSDVICKIRPSEEFINLFMDSLDDSKTYIEKYMIAETMFEYVKGDNKLDLDNFLVPIRSRNSNLRWR